MELFHIEPGLAIWTWIAFGILFVILAKFVFPSLLGGIRERESLIAKSVDDAEEIQKRLKEIEEKQAEILENAKTEADAILLNTRKESDQLRKKLMAKAEEESAQLIQQTKEKMEEERNLLLLSMRREIADFVCDLSQIIIGSSFTTEADHERAMELVKTL